MKKRFIVMAGWFIVTALFMEMAIMVYAASASVTFGSNYYESAVGETFPIGVYINGDEPVGMYHVEISYDSSRLQYVSGATAAEDGLLILEGVGDGTVVKYWLEFNVQSEGEAFIEVTGAVVNGVADVSVDETPVVFEISDLASAPIYLAAEVEEDETEEENPEEGENPEDGEAEGENPENGEAEGENPEEEGENPEDREGEGENPEDGEAEGENPEEEGVNPKDGETEGENPEEEGKNPEDGEAERENPQEELEERSSQETEPEGEAQNRADQNTQAADIPASSVLPGSHHVGENIKVLVVVMAGLTVTAGIIVLLYLEKRERKFGKDISDQKGKNRETRENDTGRMQTPEDGIIISEISDETEEAREEKEKRVVIDISDVSMNFEIATINTSGIKEYIIRRLKKQITHKKLQALNHVDFKVYQGEVVGIIGTNGSGKSTLLKIISGALKPSGGQVVVDRSKVQLLTLGTGFDMELTARENVYLNGSIIGYSKEFLDQHYDEIVKFAELEEFMEEKVKNFSSGMVSRLGFSIATAGEAAEILILDEVLSVGDEFFRKKSLERIKEMIHGGSTVLMVSHSLTTIREHCTKVVWIEKGELRMIGKPGVVCEAYREMEG